MLAFVRYAELPLPATLNGLVVSVWTVSVGGDAWVEHEAIPDGCIELIRRHSGRSIWREEQSALFATGMSPYPIRLRFSGDACFTGIKLWPWAWHALGGAPCASFADRWIPVAEDDALAALLPETGDVVARLMEAGLAPSPLGNAILAATGVADIARDTGLSHRQLQRIFAREFGMPPRSYLRLLRLRKAMASIEDSRAPLAGAAAETGYADQAHMARDFRELAGRPPRDVRGRAKGPFV